MADFMSSEKRSALMSRIRGKDTRPEMVVRRLVHGMGYRYRLHRKNLPGSPDLVFSGRRKVVFVHGCFWHRHPGCTLAATPSTRVEFWRRKFEQNVERDQRVVRRLKEMGWKVMIVWECETTDIEALAIRLKEFLDK